MTNVGLIVAAGRGNRVGGRTPKQYRSIGGRTILRRSIEALLDEDRISAVQVVIHGDDADLYEKAVSQISDKRLLPPAWGGDTRTASVKNGLTSLAKVGPTNVLIHDAARPFLSGRIINDLIGALDASDGAFPAIPVSDALWHKEMTPVDRSMLVRAQTPQAFNFHKIYDAHQSDKSAALDDVEVAVAAGMTVVRVEGEERNFKVTTQEDLERAAGMVEPRTDVRVGHGYDVHAFSDGESVILNGVEIAHGKSLKGHSDADVAMHAITDALYGALAEGDIGRWFPPSDPQWKGAASDIFLKHAVELVSQKGFQISNLDSTIICELPKIGPHADKMRARLSKIMSLSEDRISVKATTSERLGFTGREEGIASTATVCLVRA